MGLGSSWKTRVLVKVPLRVSFFGGGTDLPSFYKKHDSLIVSCAIDKHVELEMTSPLTTKQLKEEIRKGRNPVFDGSAVFKKECNEWGMGLGSSSAAAVAMEAIEWLLSMDEELDPMQVAEAAFFFESISSKLGKQDHLASAHGGFRAYRISGEKTEVLKTFDEFETLWIENKCLLWPLGQAHDSVPILNSQDASTDSNMEGLLMLKAIAMDGMTSIVKMDTRNLGWLLTKSWGIKKRLADGISSDEIDSRFGFGLGQEGCAGGKLLGAGGGGYFLFLFDSWLQRNNALRNLENSETLKISRHGIQFDIIENKIDAEIPV
jgi:D-glycero-alpha-D-manno-heptose-7-phosphate kinase